MEYTYVPKGVCSRKIVFQLEDGVIGKIQFEGGCDGNLKGLVRLAENRPVEEVIALLGGIQCGFKNTSCPDQLSKALRQASEAQQEQAG